MELIPINKQKLKIILSCDDMMSFDITSTELDYSSEKTRKALMHILEKAKSETGFDADDERLYIEVFPSLDGGCEIFLTKRATPSCEYDGKSRLHFKRRHTSLNSNINSKGSYIARSENIEDIISLCIRLKIEGFDGKSSLYTIGRQYILKLEFKSSYPQFSQGCDKSFLFICDYCEIKSEDNIYFAYLEEHAKKIIEENAVEKIQNFFGE